MSDRRPSKLWVIEQYLEDAVPMEKGRWWFDEIQAHEATADDLLAVVRWGVESGTIKGEVVKRMCVEHRSWLRDGDPSSVCAIYLWVRQYQGTPTRCKIVERLVIGPVSDGGSET